MDPFCTIEDFFSALSLQDHRKYILSMVKAASSQKCWKREDPGSLLYFQKKLSDLIGAAHRLRAETTRTRSKKQKPSFPAEVPGQDAIEPSLYMNKLPGADPWALFPRSLSRKEFLDPYRVFPAFFRRKSLKQWQKDLGEIVFYALSPHDSAEDLAGFEFLRINRSLQKLVEAAHLIWVREINPASVKT